MYDELVKELRDSAEWADRLALLMGRAEGDAHAPIMREAADAIEELSKPRWIPVTERLPDDGQWVLVWGHGQHIPVMMFRESGAWIDDQFEFHTTVTHWMPLPKPPKEETE